jgi:hypothetical protein
MHWSGGFSPWWPERDDMRVKIKMKTGTKPHRDKKASGKRDPVGRKAKHKA